MADKKKGLTSAKHVQISKSQSTILAIIVATTAIAVFGLVATKSLIVKGAYQRRALHARRQVADQLKDNYSSASQLFNQYKVFAQQNPNIIGGKSTDNSSSGDVVYKCNDGSTVTVPKGVSLNDNSCKPAPVDNTSNAGQGGNNPQIVLDALPSSYDAPALASSIEKVLGGESVSFNSLSVTDDGSGSNSSDSNPQPKSVTFSFEGTASYENATKLFQDFERSIRPFDLNTLEITGEDQKLKVTVGMTTYYQPAKNLDLTANKEVK